MCLLKKKKNLKIVCAWCIKYPICFTSVLGIYLLMSSKASKMLWHMSGNCLTSLLRRVIDSADNVSKRFSDYSECNNNTVLVGRIFRQRDVYLRESFNLKTCLTSQGISGLMSNCGNGYSIKQ